MNSSSQGGKCRFKNLNYFRVFFQLDHSDVDGPADS